MGSEVRELKLGSTFNTKTQKQPHTTTSFHTLKYDFKPASVDLTKTATLNVGTNNQVTITMPHLESSGVPNTVFKGNSRNYTKECVLIIDKVTGEITLEKLHHNIQVKKTRSENNSKSMAPIAPLAGSSVQSMMMSGNAMQASGSASMNSMNSMGSMSGSGNTIGSSNCMGSGSSSSSGNAAGVSGQPHRPHLENSTQRVSTKTRVSTGTRKTGLGSIVQRHSPIQSSPSHPHHRSPQQAPAWNANNGQSTLPSIPMIGMDDDFLPTVPPNSNSNSSNSSTIATTMSTTSTAKTKVRPPSSSQPSTFDSIPPPLLPPPPQQQSSSHHQNHFDTEVGVLTSSDSSDSSDTDDDSASDSDSDDDDDDDDNDGNGDINMRTIAPSVGVAGATAVAAAVNNGQTKHSFQSTSHHHPNNSSHFNQHNQHNSNHHNSNNTNNNRTGALPALLLDEDLRLSESNSSDSDD